MANLLLRHVYKVYPGTGKTKKSATSKSGNRSGDFVAVNRWHSLYFVPGGSGIPPEIILQFFFPTLAKTSGL